MAVKFTSLEPFIPSGADFNKSRELFKELGFDIRWESGGYIGFQKDNCRFILQEFDDKHFAENLMMSLAVSDLDEYWKEVNKKELTAKYKIRLSEPKQMPYGREFNLIDLAGVCWHIIQAAP